MRRFIAGAQCPACQSLDSLYVNSEETAENYQHLYCIRCDYHSERKHSESNQEQTSERLTQEGLDDTDKEGKIKWH